MRHLRKDVEDYVSQLSGSNAEDAWHSLVEAGPAALPHVVQAFERAVDRDVRVALVEVVSEYRSPEAVPFLAALLREPDAKLWKAALDGLVMVGGSAAFNALASTRLTSLPEQRDWIDEAMSQITNSDLQ
jgi:HEAT repeats